MGCQVVSVYNDEVAGVMGYPETILNDLLRRDYSTANLLKQLPQKHDYFLYGFTQSFAQASMYSYVLNQKQYLVYTSGRFLVVAACADWTQKALMHEDKIMGLDLRGKLCVTGTIGGRLILWDLQFFEQKVNIQMPGGSINFSSISLSGKYIFCTDSVQPNNNVYCYDIRTTKMKAKGVLGSFQPTLKGVSWGSNFHVTAAADGVWFSCYNEAEGIQLDITKGMFRIYPKTSMSCLAVVDETYVISGSIDGYVFLWAHLQCQKAIRVADGPISEMCLHKNNLIVSNFSDNVRVFSYTITKKNKMEEDEKKNGEITEDFVTIVIDSYEKPPLQSIVVSKLDQSVYFAQTRSGTLFNKMIPAVEYFNKTNSYKNLDTPFMEYDRESLKCIEDGILWSINVNRPFFMISEMAIEKDPKEWAITNKYISTAKKYMDSDKPMFFLIPKLKKVCYVGDNQVNLVEIGKIDSNEDIKISQLKEQTLLKFQTSGEKAVDILGVTYFCLKDHYFIIVLFNLQYVLLKQTEDEWVQQKAEDYEGEIVKSIEIQGTIVELQNVNNMYRVKIKGFDQSQVFKAGFMHCMNDIEAMSLIAGMKISIGADSIMVSK